LWPKCWLLYSVLPLFPPLKILNYYLENGSSSKEKNDIPSKRQTKKSRNANSKKTIERSVSTKEQKNQKTDKTQAEDPPKTRTPSKAKKTNRQFSPAPSTSSVLEKIIPSRNDIAKNVTPSASPKKSKKHAFLKLFLTDFVQSVIREELGKKQ